MCRDEEQERGVWTECDLCGGEIRRGDRYYRVAGENVCRKCLADFAAQILAVEDAALAARLDGERTVMAAQIAEKEAKLQAELA